MIMHKSNIFVLIFLSSILLVSSQSIAIDSQINNRSCNVDSDCVNNPKNGTFSTRLGNFMCVNNHCKFVVAAGKLFSFTFKFFSSYDPCLSNSFHFI